MTDSAPSKALTLLVADDEAMILRAVTRVFERRGHRVLAAATASEALAFLEEHHFDAVLVDQNMPGSGLTVLEKLFDDGHAFEGVAVLMTGGLDEGEARHLSGKVTRLQKPFRFGDVVPLVEDHFT